MAIARRSGFTNSSGSLEIANATAGEPIRKGAAIGITLDGSAKIIEVSSVVEAFSFVGFSVGDYVVGDTVRALTIRGSTLTPISEGGLGLNIGTKVFLSSTKGEITETPPIYSGSVLIQVGVSSSTDQIILITDFRVKT